MLFDYSLTKGEEQIVIDIQDGVMSEQDAELTAACTSDNILVNSGKSYKTMTLDFYFEGEFIDHLGIGNIKWIRGIGSNAGLLDNFYGPDGAGSVLLSVYHNDELVYSADTDAIKNLRTNNEDNVHSGDATKYHLDGTPFAKGESSLYIQNGKVYLAK